MSANWKDQENFSVRSFTSNGAQPQTAVGGMHSAHESLGVLYFQLIQLTNPVSACLHLPKIDVLEYPCRLCRGKWPDLFCWANFSLWREDGKLTNGYVLKEQGPSTQNGEKVIIKDAIVPFSVCMQYARYMYEQQNIDTVKAPSRSTAMLSTQ